MSATSHAPKEGSAETRHITPASRSKSCASSTAFVRRPTGNCKPTDFAFRPRMTSSSLAMSLMEEIARSEGSDKTVAHFAFGVSITIRHGVGSFTPAFRSAIFASATWSAVVSIERIFVRCQSDGPAERRPHPLGDSVRPCSRRDLVLPQDVVREEAELEVVRVPHLLRDVPVRGDPRGLEGDVTDLALLLRDEVELHGELRPQVPDVPLSDPDLRDPAHVLLAGVRLSADLSVHRVRFAGHGLKAPS